MMATTLIVVQLLLFINTVNMYTSSSVASIAFTVCCSWTFGTFSVELLLRVIFLVHWYSGKTLLFPAAKNAQGWH